MHEEQDAESIVQLRIYIDDASTPVATYRPPARFHLDTRSLGDGEHTLRIEAVDALGNVGARIVPFTVQNGPGITVTGLRPGRRVRGEVDVDINAFSGLEPFDPVRAESSGPIPVWTWVLIIIIGVWAAWYGLEYFPTPPAFAQTPTYAPNPALVAANAPLPQAGAPTQAPVSNPATGSKNVAGFDYSTLGAQVYSTNCASCHGEGGAGTPGVFPPLVKDPVVTGKDADAQIKIVLHGLSGKGINGTKYAAQMPAFGSQLSDAQIAAVVDHERTSWGNQATTVTPDQVSKDR